MGEIVYLVENGDVFEGSMAQFQDCFFSNANDASIRQWAAERGWTVTTRGVNCDDCGLPAPRWTCPDEGKAHLCAGCAPRYSIFYPGIDATDKTWWKEHGTEWRKWRRASLKKARA